MFYPMVQKELKALGEDLLMLSEEMYKPAPQEPPQLPSRVKPIDELFKEVNYIRERLNATWELIRGEKKEESKSLR